jgi:hypothetical protein
MSLLATVVDTTALAKVVVASLIIGIGVTLAFSLAILGATRFAELRSAERVVEAGAYAALATIGFAVCAAAVVLGIVVMTSK